MDPKAGLPLTQKRKCNEENGQKHLYSVRYTRR